MTRRVASGTAEPLGVAPVDGGINVAVFSANATGIDICLFDDSGTIQIERIALPARTDGVFHAHISDVGVGTRYGLRAHGPYAPEQGHRFNAAKLLIDPHALALDSRFSLDASQLGFAQGDPYSAQGLDQTDSAAFVPKAIVTDALSLRRAASHVRVPWSETIVYEMHVRGFTKQHPDIPQSLQGTFAALAEPAALDHLRRLGITTVELMPSAAWIDERHLPALGLSDYWGYNSVAMLAPDPRLAPGGWIEVRRAVDALHGAGLEVILDVVLNHSGESDEFGPTLSLRGLDNASYYRLHPGAGARYVNDTGCGNCLALDRAPTMRLALAALRAWVEYGGVDGFRFDLATALGRREESFDAHAPLLAAIADDPTLHDAKLIVEPWDIGPGGYQLGAFPARFGEWNDRFRDDIRRYWRGDAGMRGALATRLAGSSDVFASKALPSRGINFVTAHDGFTLADLVAYATKHNTTNGENNRDGADENLSWNHGVEGESDDPSLRDARLRDQRNLLASLLLSRGTPMLSMGSELGATQQGNNNAYAQDNAISWLDWAHTDAHLLEFTSRLIRLRRAHAALRADRFLEGAPIDETGIPDIEWRSTRGPLVDPADWEAARDDALGAVFYATTQSQSGGDRVAVIVHREGAETQIRLPDPREGSSWTRVLDTSAPQSEPKIERDTDATIAGRSVVVFEENPNADGMPRFKTALADERSLAPLVDAAGISQEWWDVGGNRHRISTDTQRALLGAMGLRAATLSQVRESLNHIARLRERRTLPFAASARSDAPFDLRIAADTNGRLPTGALIITNDEGLAVATIAAPRTCDKELRDTLGLRLRRASVALPVLPTGRYIARFDSMSHVACRLSVAPRACHLPGFVTSGQRRFGLSAQLYSLRRDGDAGIGDFTTLAEAADAAARVGASTFGINPLHMLFARDRERASPYHPSDRRFLDPLYLDIDALDDLPGFVEAARTPFDATLRDGHTIDYPAIWSAKDAFLRSLFAAFERFADAQPNAAQAISLDAFVSGGGSDLVRFATFEAIASAHRERTWREWPAELRDARSESVHRFAKTHARDVRYAMFLQWLADRQLGAAASRARDAGLEIGLYRDLAIGCAPDGAEAWRNAALFAAGVSVGAPPDPLGPEGQVWNLPPPNPLANYETGYAAFGAVVAANMRHAGALRIDHVLGLSRLFWVPDGGRAADGAYVASPFEALVGEVAIESERARCLVVGEDLGTVPEGLRARLAQARMLSYRVALLERQGSGFVDTRTYPVQAVACASTHDLAPLAGWWDATDLRERHALRLIDDLTLQAQIQSRREEKNALLRALADAGWQAAGDIDAPIGDDTIAALHALLAASPSALMLIQVEDLAGETIGQNLPGTDRERANWRRRLPASLERLLNSSRATAILSAVEPLRRSTQS